MSADRRTVLKGLGAGGVVIAGGLIGRRLIDGDDDGSTVGTTAAPPPDPRSSVGDALVAVGARYLEEFPEEADQALLLDALPALGGVVPERRAAALVVLEPQVVADHEAGDLVELDGWVLSRTESRAAALYAV